MDSVPRRTAIWISGHAMKPWFYRSRNLSVLVATDVAARGLDIDALDCVSCPSGRRSGAHVHRSVKQGGRSKRGMALSLGTATKSAERLNV